MRLFTSGSDKSFLAVWLVCLALITACFYIVVQGRAAAMINQKTDDRYNNFVHSPPGWNVDAVIMGTSHGELWDIRGNVHFISLTAPHTIPTVMYFKAKTILKYHPEAKVVYLEADDHLFFNGEHYTLDGFTPEQKRDSKVFVWNANFIDGDEEKNAVFGEVAPHKPAPRLLLQDDVRPIIIKRMMARLFFDSSAVVPPTTLPLPGNTCDLAAFYPPEVDLSRESRWSGYSEQERNRRMNERIQEHRLDQPSPMKAQMLEYYEKTIQLLQAHNIAVVLVLSPEAKEFEARKNPEGQKIHQAFLHTLMDKYHLRLLDFRHFSEYGDRFFDDQDHPDGSLGWLVGKGIMQDFCEHEFKR